MARAQVFAMMAASAASAGESPLRPLEPLAQATPGLSPAQLDHVRELLRRATGVALGAEKAYLIDGRLARVAREEGLQLDALATRLIADARAQALAVEALLNHETSFFRDWHPFEALREVVLPQLFAAAPPGRRVRIWSAACATGQEPYSLAIMLREHFPAEAARVELLATDVSEAALARARAGSFTQLEVNRGLPTRLLFAHFRREGSRWVARPELQQMVTFRPLNLLRDPFPAPVDLLLLRNALIYFDLATSRSILERAGAALAPGGRLVLGGAESTLALGSDDFEVERLGKSLLYRLRPQQAGGQRAGGQQAGGR
ncbi:MAG: protein-glutamate O-methyltransferase CheR [Planctomycetota bacterium]